MLKGLLHVGQGASTGSSDCSMHLMRQASQWIWPQGTETGETASSRQIVQVVPAMFGGGGRGGGGVVGVVGVVRVVGEDKANGKRPPVC